MATVLQGQLLPSTHQSILTTADPALPSLISTTTTIQPTIHKNSRFNHHFLEICNFMRSMYQKNLVYFLRGIFHFGTVFQNFSTIKYLELVELEKITVVIEA